MQMDCTSRHELWWRTELSSTKHLNERIRYEPNTLISTMNYDPLTQTLRTSSGRLIKRMHCPYRLSEDDLDPGLRCRQCERTLVDAHSLPEETLADLLVQQPDTCLKLDLDHPELRITHERL